MKKGLPFRLVYLALACVFALLLSLIFWKLVPPIEPYRMTLLPLLALVLATTAARLERGLLVFCFLFPLLNGLPYFFGIDERIPHAPTALLLFLALALGWLVHHTVKPATYSGSEPVFRPMLVFSAIVLVSGLVTFLRYADFFPFLSPALRGLVVNADGVRAGRAMMSVVLNGLVYLTGFVFFFILLNTLKSEVFLRRIMTVMSGSLALSVLFSLVQRFFSVRLGNTSFWVWLDRVNGTFKDPNALGAYLAAFLPMLFALTFSSPARRRAPFVILIALSLFLCFSMGSRSGLIGVSVSLPAFFLMLGAKGEPAIREKLTFLPGLAALFFLAVLSFSLMSRDLVPFKQTGKGLTAAQLDLRMEYWGSPVS
jgi:hypothetical protein